MKKLSDYIVDYKLISKFDPDSLKKNLVLPILEDEVYTICAICKESNLEFAKSCFFNLIKFIEVSKAEVLFYLSSLTIKSALYNYVHEAISTIQDDHRTIKEFLEKLLVFSIEKRASDIHIETSEQGLVIRFRVDGKLKQFFCFPKEFYRQLSSIIKLHCNLDITQYRKPMDARMSFVLVLNEEKIKYDFRVSIMPTILGESIVIRILDNQEVQKKLSSLEFSSTILNSLDEINQITQGLVLVCGPTGSGKTTTLYSLINSFDKQSKKIITVEDPVEYKIDSVQQIAVNEKLELGFADILRNILRQDPDIIFIGEIRDATSLKIAIQASLTGHLVLSTIHSSSALNSLSRLLQLEAQNFLLASTLKAVFYQRLVLKVCPHCNFEGCVKCNYTKYQGRTAIGEVIKMDENLSSLIAQDCSFDRIKEYLKKRGFESILDDAKKKVKRGITSLDEVYRVLGFENEV